MKVHILSDLHLEFEAFAPPKVAADLVVLAGDIDVGVRGVRWAREAFHDVPVAYIAGNHEYYREAIPRLDEKLRAEAEGSSVHVLEQETLDVCGVTVLGCTLWTDLALEGDPFVGATAVANVMSDFKLIRVAPRYRRLRPMDTELMHRRALDWLRSELASKSGPSIVVTHHAPSSRSLDPRYANDPTNAAYASSLDDFILDQQPSLWIHGHVHTRSDYLIGSTRVICNPRGYPDEPCSDFEPGLVVEVLP